MLAWLLDAFLCFKNISITTNSNNNKLITQNDDANVYPNGHSTICMMYQAAEQLPISLAIA